MSVIQRDFLPTDLEPILAQQAVEGTVVVQADQSLEETEFLLQLAEANPFIKGVVGWVDLCAPNIEDQIHALTKHEKLRGFRHILQSEQPEFMLKPSFLHGIKTLTQYNFTYDLLIYPHQLKAARELVEQNPQQPFVLDHLAKPYIKKGELDAWAKDLWLLAQNENVYCKLSGIITEADHKNWTAEQLYPYMDIALAAFGVDRIMFGSDWPVCKLAGNYHQVVDLVDGYLDGYPQEDIDKILGLNAVRFYQLDT